MEFLTAIIEAFKLAKPRILTGFKGTITIAVALGLPRLLLLLLDSCHRE
jgi:hypothetical protein